MILRKCLIGIFTFAVISASGQDTTVFKLDSSWINESAHIFSGRIFMSYDYIYHYPDSADYEFYEENKLIVNESLTEENHERYYRMAFVLWELEKLDEAKKMLLNIYNSKLQAFNSTYHSNSDIPGDTTTNYYGYGSFSSHPKNDVCEYLCKLYIEQRNFSKALYYLDKAANTYKANYTCGTGYYHQKNKYNSFYASCYEGLGYYQKVMQLLLPVCLEWDCQPLIRSIRKMYKQEVILAYLAKAEKSISFKTDDHLSYSYTTHDYGLDTERNDTTYYYGGEGTIILFNKKISLPAPQLGNMEKLTRDHYVRLFRETSFYRQLSGEEALDETSVVNKD